MIQRRWGAGSGSSGLVSTTSSPSCRALSLSSPTSSLLDRFGLNNIKSILPSSLSLHQRHHCLTAASGGWRRRSSPSPPQLASLEVSLPFSSQKPFVPMGLGANLASPPKWARAASLSPPADQRHFWQGKGTMSAGGAQGRRRSSRLFGRRSTDLSGAHCIFKTSDQLGEIILKSESFFS